MRSKAGVGSVEVGEDSQCKGVTSGPSGIDAAHFFSLASRTPSSLIESPISKDNRCLIDDVRVQLEAKTKVNSSEEPWRQQSQRESTLTMS